MKSKVRSLTLYLKNRNRFIDIENRLGVVKEEGRGSGMDWEFGVSRCKYYSWNG